MRLLARSFLVGLTIVGASAIFMGACSNQGEGDRCDADNGNDDCEDGLVCERGPNVCCPQDPSQATTIECQAKQTPGGEAGIPSEASTDSALPSEASTDAATDSSAPDSSDDASDANDDGG